MTAALRTRRPAGGRPWPLVLVEGPEHAGASWQALALSASPRVGRCLVVPAGERDLDRFADVGEFEIVDVNGTHIDLVDQLSAARDIPAPDDPDRDHLLVVDGERGLWAQLMAWGSRRTRDGAANRRLLEADPAAPVKIPPIVWEDIHSRHDQIMGLLREFPGIVAVTARGGHGPTVDQAGAPLPGGGRYRVDGDRGLPSAADVWVRVHRHPRRVELISVRAAHDVDAPQDLPLDGGLERLLFDELRPTGGWRPRDTTSVVPTVVDRKDAQQWLLTEIENAAPPGSDVRDEANRVWRQAGLAGRREITEDDIVRAMAAVGVSDPKVGSGGQTEATPADGPPGEAEGLGSGPDRQGGAPGAEPSSGAPPTTAAEEDPS